MSSLVDLVEYNRWANYHLFALVDRASAEGLAASQSGMYGSMLETLQHLVSVERNFLRAIRGDPRDRLGALDVDGLRAVMQPLGDEYAAALALETDLDRPVFVPWLQGGVNIRLTDAVIQPIIHSIQPRADLVGALSREGIESPELDYVRWVLDGRQRTPA
jgi:uncharacterized damage-inducible protein DinB